MKPSTIPLGYEVGSGAPVELPLKHMVITGQTQEAGKTTALEALISRSGLRAVTFITKRGEGSFIDARRIDPYFREQADWQFVASILEASRGEKLKFERAWIIRASKGARTLADVQRNVRKAMESAKGMSADVYLTLDAYLEAVVPQIAQVRWAPSLQLAAGVNAMDLTKLNVEMQHLVIKSSLDWVLAHEEGVVVVIPEAWKFIPQGRGTPVKLAAESYIRQAAGLKNYLWLDSQDIAGVEKIILKSAPVWVLGVQREANEIKRTLDNIPAGIAKPSKADIATLELGQFYACWGRQALKTYVQPAWMSEAVAIKVARGQDDVRHHHPPAKEQNDMANNEDVARLERENEQLKTENADLRRRLEALETRPLDAGRPHLARQPGAERSSDHLPSVARDRPTAGPSAPARFSFTDDGETVYQAIKARLIAESADDPQILRVLTNRPELQVEVKRSTLSVEGDTLKGRLARMIAEGFFDSARKGNAAFEELKRRGAAVAKPGVYNMCDQLAKDGFLTKEDEGYRAVSGMKVNIVEAA